MCYLRKIFFVNILSSLIWRAVTNIFRQQIFLNVSNT